MSIVYVQQLHDGTVQVGSAPAAMDVKRLTARGPVWAWYPMVENDSIVFLTICNEAKIRAGEGASAIDVICATAKRTELFPQPVIGWRSRPGSEPSKEEASASIMRSMNALDDGHGVTMGSLCNRARKFTNSMMRSAAADLARSGRVRIDVSTHPVNGKIITRLFLP